MAYNEGRHHPIGKAALRKYAVPFLQNKPLSTGDRVRTLLASVRRFFSADS
jgi:hypothetical protein